MRSRLADLVGLPTIAARAEVLMDQDGSTGSTESRDTARLGRIPLKQVRIKRGESAGRSTNPVNLLVPYLDLFWRLDDEELGRLAHVDADIVGGLRKQVIEVDRAMARYADLLPRLSDAELVRLTGATEKTIRFWRLCQARPRPRAQDRASEEAVVAKPPARNKGKGETSKSEDVPDPQPVTQKGEETPAAEEDPTEERRDSRISIDPTAQATVDAMMTFSGAPFPGYDDGESKGPPPPDEISLADVEAPDVGHP